MPSLYDILFNNPLNLYKSYKLVQYIIASGHRDNEIGHFRDEREIYANEECCGLGVTNTTKSIGIATIKSPFLLLYNSFTSSDQLNKMAREDYAEAEALKHHRRNPDYPAFPQLKLRKV